MHNCFIIPYYRVQWLSITRHANLAVHQLWVGEYATLSCLSSSIETIEIEAYWNLLTAIPLFVSQGRLEFTKIMSITRLYASLSHSFVPNNVLYSCQVANMGCVFCHSLFTYGHVLSLMFQFMWAFIDNCTHCYWAITEMACRYRNLKMNRYNITNIDFRCNMNLRYPCVGIW